MREPMQHEDPQNPSLETPQPVQRGLFGSPQHRWTPMAHSLGVVQTRILMVVFYLFLAVPTGILMRLSGDRLHLKRPKDGNWHPHRHEDQSLETAKRQF